MPNIFEYTDYRKYLGDLYQHRKALNRAFSYRLIAQKAGLASPSFIGKILSGAANISHETLMRLCDAFQIIGTDAEYFELMVHFDASRSELDKSHYFQRMRALKRRHASTADDSEDILGSAWYLAPILSLIELGLFHGDHAALGRMLTPPITAQESRLAIELLLLHGKLHKDHQGRIVATGTGKPSDRPEAPTSQAIPCDTRAFLQGLPYGTSPELRERIERVHSSLLRMLQEARDPRGFRTSDPT